MGFSGEEKGQIEDISSLAIKIALLLLFFVTIAYSYDEYHDRKEPMERFSAGLDFADALKNNVMCARIGGAPNPGLIRESDMDGFGYREISRHWTAPYNFEVVIRDTDGGILYEQGALTRKGLGTGAIEKLGKVSVAYAVVAVQDEEGTNRAARMEVWVWS